MKLRKIRNIRELKEFSKDGIDCSVLLNFGVKSTKHIIYNKTENKFEIDNYIDGSIQNLTEKELWTKSNIGKALDLGALMIEVG